MTKRLCFFMLFFSFLATSFAQSKSLLYFPKVFDVAKNKIRTERIMDKEWNVVVFLGSDCPISQKYTSTLNALKKQFPTVNFVGMFTKWEEADMIKTFQAAYSVEIPLYWDRTMQFAKSVGALVMPEAMLIHFSDGKYEIVYQGAIDNWFYELGKYREKATENYLSEAIQAALEQKNIKIRHTKAIGCYIQY